MMTKLLFTTQENHYSLTISKLGLRETVGYSMSLWERTMERKVCELYRELAVFKNKRGPESKKIKKSIQAIFRENELKIIIQCNLKVVDYLDVTFNFTDSSYRPFNKTNNEINYIHKQSNHPPSIIKQLPLSVERRLSKLSSNEKIFNDSIPIYQEALIKAGYNHKLTYHNYDQKKDNSQQRKRQIT